MRLTDRKFDSAWGGARAVAWRLMLAVHCACFHRRSDAFGPFRGVIPARPESVGRPQATWAHVYPLIPAVARRESACSARVHGSQGSSGWPLTRDERLAFKSGKAASCVNGWSSVSREDPPLRRCIRENKRAPEEPAQRRSSPTCLKAGMAWVLLDLIPLPVCSCRFDPHQVGASVALSAARPPDIVGTGSGRGSGIGKLIL